MKKSKFKNILLERIPCPIDPSHSIYKHNLLLHSKICNIRTRQLEMREELFYCLNCNSGVNSSSSDQNQNDENESYLDIINSSDISDIKNDVTVADDDVIASIVDPDLLLIKIKECYLRLEESKELCFLKDNFKNTEERKSEKIKSRNVENKNDFADKMIDKENEKENENENENDNEINVPEEIGDNPNKNTYKRDILESASDNTHSMSEESYELLENRVVSAVSGDQVAFDRVRHAQQDAMIVR